MVGENDSTYTVKVLGLVVTEGTEESAKEIIRLLGAKKVNCQYSMQHIRTVMCTV